MYRYAARFMAEKQNKIKNRFDKKRIADPLNLGDSVYVFDPRVRKSELKAPWNGPYLIVGKSKNVYELMIDGKHKWLPRDRLRRCRSQPDDVDENEIESNCETGIADETVYHEQIQESSFSDDPSSNDENEGESSAYNLRPRPLASVQRLQVSQLKVI